jgi:hypothetical protein
LVGVYFGVKKPESSNIFIRPLVAELNDILQSHFSYNERTFNITLKWIICDTPAKKFVKNSIGATGYYSCDNCTTRGQYSQQAKTVVFPEMDAPRRTDTSFRNRTQEEHHHEQQSEFESLPIDIILKFTLDSLHVLYKGVGLKLLIVLQSGPLNFRISIANQNELSNLLIDVGKYVPSDFQRKPRAFHHIRLWKATEIRFFLIYLVPLVLPQFVSDGAVMDLYLCLHLIAILLNSDNLVPNQHSLIDSLVAMFYTRIGDLFGPDFFSLIVHCLQHLCEDYHRHGSVEKFSTFQMKTLIGMSRGQCVLHTCHLHNWLIVFQRVALALVGWLLRTMIAFLI